METELEQELLESGEPLRAEILKVGHHGSRTSTSAEFLSVVNPKFALISAGLDNSYGHPHAEVLRRLERFRVITFRTDRDRDIVARTSGGGWQVARQELRFFSDLVTFLKIRPFYY